MAACGRGTADVLAIFINALCVSRFWLIIKLFPFPAYKTCAMIIYKYLINCNGLSTFLTLSCFVFVSVSFLLLLLLLSLLQCPLWFTALPLQWPPMAGNGHRRKREPKLASLSLPQPQPQPQQGHIYICLLYLSSALQTGCSPLQEDCPLDIFDYWWPELSFKSTLFTLPVSNSCREIYISVIHIVTYHSIWDF